MKVYFISGLGADRRVFTHTRLPKGYECVHLDWIPAQKNESLPDYAARLASPIDTNKPFALLGLSMGGMLASEINRQFSEQGINPVATILISSVAVHSDLPRYFKLAHILALHKIVPIRFLKAASYLKRFVFRGQAADDVLLNQVIKESDPAFIRWAMSAVLEWRNVQFPSRIFHLHGTHDRILPLKRRPFTQVVPGGGHMIIMEKPAEINRFIAEALAKSRSSSPE